MKETKDLLDLLMDMYDEETNSVMDDEELRSQVTAVTVFLEGWYYNLYFIFFLNIIYDLVMNSMNILKAIIQVI